MTKKKKKEKTGQRGRGKAKRDRRPAAPAGKKQPAKKKQQPTTKEERGKKTEREKKKAEREKKRAEQEKKAEQQKKKAEQKAEREQKKERKKEHEGEKAETLAPLAAVVARAERARERSELGVRGPAPGEDSGGGGRAGLLVTTVGEEAVRPGEPEPSDMPEQAASLGDAGDSQPRAPHLRVLAADLDASSTPEHDEATLEDTRAYLKGLIEALVFVSDHPLTLKELARAAKIDKKRTEELLGELRAERESSGVQIEEVAGGFVLRSNPAYAEAVRHYLSMRPVRLSRAQLETLAIIAYRQPITRPEVDDIRGVDTGPVLKGLLERDLVRILGKKDEPGRPMLYGTTPFFLELFSMQSLRDLPTLKEFTELTDESRATFERQIGEDAPESLADLEPVPPGSESATSEPASQASDHPAADESGGGFDTGHGEVAEHGGEVDEEAGGYGHEEHREDEDEGEEDEEDEDEQDDEGEEDEEDDEDQEDEEDEDEENEEDDEDEDEEDDEDDPGSDG